LELFTVKAMRKPWKVRVQRKS